MTFLSSIHLVHPRNLTPQAIAAAGWQSCHSFFSLSLHSRALYLCFNLLSPSSFHPTDHRRCRVTKLTLSLLWLVFLTLPCPILLLLPCGSVYVRGWTNLMRCGRESGGNRKGNSAHVIPGPAVTRVPQRRGHGVPSSGVQQPGKGSRGKREKKVEKVGQEIQFGEVWRVLAMWGGAARGAAVLERQVAR